MTLSLMTFSIQCTLEGDLHRVLQKLSAVCWNLAILLNVAMLNVLAAIIPIVTLMKQMTKPSGTRSSRVVCLN